MPGLAPAAVAALITGIGGAASTGLGALAASKKGKQAKELATINQTDPGFENFGDELVEERSQRGPSITLADPRAKRRIFPTGPNIPTDRRVLV
jgi:hypothetical protein